MSQRSVQQRKKSKKALSRRTFLIGLGAIGSMATLGLCGSASVAAYLLGNQAKSHRATPTITANPPTITPVPPLIPEITSREEWGALPPNHNAVTENGFYSDDNPEGWLIYEDELHEVYRTAIIHHTAFYSGTDLQTVEDVQTLHRNDRGWADVAYHFLVGRTGVIYEGRDWTVRGTHVDSYNTGSLGICLLGNFMEQTPTDAQLASTRRLVIWLAYRLQLSHIAAHRTFNGGTLCPGDNLLRYLPEFAAVANLKIGTEGYVPPDDVIECTCCNCAPSGD